MANPTLLRLSRSFDWEHSNAHRYFLGAMSPLYRFSTLPYFIDPRRDDGMWRLTHQRAHQDAMTTLPFYPYTGVPFTQNLIDLPLSKKSTEQVSFWLFQNHNEHYVGQTQIPADLERIFPFW